MNTQTNRPDAELSRIVESTIKDSDRFYPQFFKALDSYRQNLPQFLEPDTAIVWNGTPIGGADAFLQMYLAMPDTQHEVLDFNLHPLPAATVPGKFNILLSTSGKVKFGKDRGKNLFGFSAVFVLKHRAHNPQQPVYVSSLSYRLTHKPEDATIQT